MLALTPEVPSQRLCAPASPSAGQGCPSTFPMLDPRIAGQCHLLQKGCLDRAVAEVHVSLIILHVATLWIPSESLPQFVIVSPVYLLIVVLLFIVLLVVYWPPLNDRFHESGDKFSP